MRRSYGLFSDIERATSQKVFNLYRDEFMVFGVSAEGLLLWTSKSGINPSVCIPYAQIVTVSEGYGRSAGGRMAGVLVAVGGSWNVQLSFLVRRFWLLGEVRIRPETLKNLVAQISERVEQTKAV